GLLAETFPQAVARGGDVDVTVGGLEHVGAGAGGVAVSFLPRNLALDQVARRLEIEEEYRRFDERRMHPLAFAGALALEEREGDPIGEGQASRNVVDRDSDAHGTLAGMSGNRHDPAHALGDLIHARPALVGAVLPEAGDAAVDDTRVHLFHRLIVDAEAVL